MIIRPVRDEDVPSLQWNWVHGSPHLMASDGERSGTIRGWMMSGSLIVLRTVSRRCRPSRRCRWAAPARRAPTGLTATGIWRSTTEAGSTRRPLALNTVLRGQLPRPDYPPALRAAAPDVWWDLAKTAVGVEPDRGHGHLREPVSIRCLPPRSSSARLAPSLGCLVVGWVAGGHRSGR